jgi:hypothetical protein
LIAKKPLKLLPSGNESFSHELKELLHEYKKHVIGTAPSSHLGVEADKFLCSFLQVYHHFPGHASPVGDYGRWELALTEWNIDLEPEATNNQNAAVKELSIPELDLVTLIAENPKCFRN